ncbi:MAG: SNF2-related protein [bacterium]
MSRPRRDLGKYKDWTWAKIERKLSALDPSPKFYTEPRHHQKICFYLLTKFPRELEILDMGLGKTKLILDAFRWHKAAKNLKRILVLVPNVVNLEGWRMEIAKHAPDLTASYLEGPKADRLAAVEDETDLCLATYSGLTHIVCARAGGKMRIDPKQLAWVQKQFDGIVWDECFPAGTLVDMVDSFGNLIKPRYIEDIRPGDTILNAIGVDYVTACRKRRVCGAVRIQVGTKKILASKNHPFFTGRGWVCAQELRLGDSILSTRSAVRMVRDGVFPKGFSGSGEVLLSILRGEMGHTATTHEVQDTQCRSVLQNEGQYASLEKEASKEGGRDDRTLPQCSCDVESRSRAEDDCHKEEERNIMSMEGEAWRERSASTGATTAASSSASRCEQSMDCGIGYQNGVQQSMGQVGLSGNVQGGHRPSAIEGGNRGGRYITQQCEGQDQGQEEGRSADFFRVESVEVLESGSSELDQFRDADGELYFYDLAVAGHPSFSVEGLLVHNCTCIFNHRSLQYKIAVGMSRDYPFRVGLTGTPLGRDPQVLWPQFYAVDRGEALGETLGIFRQTFFHETAGYWGGTDRVFKKKMTKDLHRLMAHSAIRYSAAECLDLPEKVAVERPFAMTDEQWSYYHAVLEQSREQATGNKLLDVGGVFVRLRQITSGFVSLSGEPSALAANPKLDSLMELIDELPEDEKLVVFNEFVWTGNQIVAALKERKIKSARLYSGTKDKQGELRWFMENESCRVFVVNSQSGAMGLNLQAAHYVVFYESPVSPIVRQQAEARCRRQGQEQTVFVYDLFARHTVDQKIMRFLAEGKDLFTALVEGGVKLLEGD